MDVQRNRVWGGILQAKHEEEMKKVKEETERTISELGKKLYSRLESYEDWNREMNIGMIDRIDQMNTSISQVKEDCNSAAMNASSALGIEERVSGVESAQETMTTAVAKEYGFLLIF